MVKIRVPRLRSVLLGMAVIAVLLFLLLHSQSKIETANRRATGLGLASPSPDASPAASIESSPARQFSGYAGGVVGGVVGGVKDGNFELKTAEPQNVSAFLLEDQEQNKAGGGGGGREQLEKKLIRTVSMNLLVKDARASSMQVQQIVQVAGGDTERAELRNVADTARSGDITLRVPANRLEEVVENLRHLAIRVQTEHWESNDVSREYLDSEARLRNMKAEEQQYLALLRRAGSMKDTLQVTEKISEVRGEIERLQGELNWMSHQVAMSAVHISLTEEPQVVVASHWRPLYNAKNNLHEMLLGLGDWVDWVVAFLIDIPLILAWACSALLLLWVAWRVVRYVWLRWLKPKPAPEVHATT